MNPSQVVAAVRLEHGGHVLELGVVDGPADEDLLVHAHDQVGEGLRQRLQEVGTAASRFFRAFPGFFVEIHGFYEHEGELLQGVRAALEDHHDDDGEPVEHVVHGGGGEGPAEGLLLAGLRFRAVSNPKSSGIPSQNPGESGFLSNFDIKRA